MSPEELRGRYSSLQADNTRLIVLVDEHRRAAEAANVELATEKEAHAGTRALIYTLCRITRATDPAPSSTPNPKENDHV